MGLSPVLTLWTALLPAATAGEIPRAAAQDLELAEGPYSELRMLYRRSIFRIRILDLSVRVDRLAQERIREMAAGRTYSEALASRSGRSSSSAG